MTRPSGAKWSSHGSVSATQARLVTSSTSCQRFELLSSGLNRIHEGVEAIIGPARLPRNNNRAPRCTLDGPKGGSTTLTRWYRLFCLDQVTPLLSPSVV